MLIAVLSAVLLAGCGRKAEPFVEAQLPPGLSARFWPPQGFAYGALVTGEDPPARYGVAAPSTAARGVLVIATGRAQPLEAWFETVGELTGRGFTVWLTEGDREAVAAVSALAMKAEPTARLTLIGHRDGAPAALAAALALPSPPALVLSSPELSPPRGPALWVLPAMGLGGMKAPGSTAWRRGQPDGMALGLTHDAWRGKVADAWRLANPDLRAPPKLRDLAQRKAALDRLQPEDLKRIKAPVLVIAKGPADSAEKRLCAALPGCQRKVAAGAGSEIPLEIDVHRALWLSAVADHAA